MSLCGIFTLGANEVEPPVLHYFYKDGKNLVNSVSGEDGMMQLFKYVGGSNVIKDLSGPSAGKYCMYSVGSNTVGVGKIDQAYMLLYKDQPVPNNDMSLALDMIALIVVAYTKRPNEPLVLGSLNDASASMLNSFLHTFLSHSPFVLTLLRDYHNIPLPRHLITPILASATLLSHMRTTLRSIGGVLIRDGRTIVSDIGVLLTNFILLHCSTGVFTGTSIEQAGPARSTVSLQTLCLTSSVESVEELRARNRDNSVPSLEDTAPYCDGLELEGPNAVPNVCASNEELSLSVLSMSSGDNLLETATFVIQLLTIRCSLQNPADSHTNIGTSANINARSSYIALSLLFHQKTMISLGNDFLAALVQSLLLIFAKLADCTSYVPVYSVSTRTSVALSLERSSELLDPLLPVPIKEAQLAASKTKRALSTYSVTEFPSEIKPQFSVQEVTLATAEPSVSTTAMYDDEHGKTYILAAEADQDGFVLRKKPMESGTSIEEATFSDI